MERATEGIKKPADVESPGLPGPAKDYKFLTTAQVFKRVSAIERKRHADAIKKLTRK
jgi:hypothetical protein